MHLNMIVIHMTVLPKPTRKTQVLFSAFFFMPPFLLHMHRLPAIHVLP